MILSTYGKPQWLHQKTVRKSKQIVKLLNKLQDTKSMYKNLLHPYVLKFTLSNIKKKKEKKKTIERWQPSREAEPTCSCPPTWIVGWFSDRGPEQSSEFQLIGIFEAKEYRGYFAPSGERFYKFKGKYPGRGTFSRGETRQKAKFSSSLLSQGGVSSPTQGILNLIGRDLGGYTESGRLRLHTHSEQHVHNCSTNQESSREIQSPVRGTKRLWPALTKRDFLLWGVVEYAEYRAVTWHCSVGATQTF